VTRFRFSAFAVLSRPARSTVCPFRSSLLNNVLDGTLPASIGLLTKLNYLCAFRASFCRTLFFLAGVRACCCQSPGTDDVLSHCRNLQGNVNGKLDGTLPASLLSLTALAYLCVPPGRPACMRVRARELCGVHWC
jgi:hypothetical protein